MASPGTLFLGFLGVLALGSASPCQEPESDSVQRLQGKFCEARLRRVESIRSAMGAAAPPSATSPFPGVPALMDALVRRDGKSLYSLCEPLLVRGPEGHAVLHDFFHAADVEHAKILILTHDLQLLYGLLRLTAIHPEKVAELSRYLMRVTRDRPRSFIRREIYNFVPVFLKHHDGCFPELREELEEDIVFQVESGLEFLNKVLYAMRELRFEPPDRSWLMLLESPQGRAAHASAIAYLAARGPDGRRILAQHVKATKDAASPVVRQALRAIGEKESSGEPEILAPFLADPRPEVRRAAREGYFSRPRGAEAAARAIEYLEADGEPRARSNLLSLIRRHSPEMIPALKERAADVRDPQLKEGLLAERAPVVGKGPDAGSASGSEGPPRPVGGEDGAARRARLEELLRQEASALPPAASALSASDTTDTHDAGRAASRSRPGTGDPAGVADLLASFQHRDAPALAAGLERWLAKGDAGHETLRDFLLEVDRKPIEEHAVARNYQVSFAVVQAVMLREVETARFVHYFLEATRDRPGSTARAMILEFAPILVRYHAGRFRDLRASLERTVLDGLAAGGESLPQCYSVMETLGFVPPIPVIEGLLVKARSSAETSPLLDHLKSRNDSDAARAVSRVLSLEARFQDPRAAALLGALAEMTTPEAERALLGYLHSGSAAKRDAAAIAYFGVERGEAAIALALEYLNSPSGVKEKTAWILRMRQRNRALLESIRARSGEVKIEAVREALQETPSLRPGSQIR